MQELSGLNYHFNSLYFTQTSKTAGKDDSKEALGYSN